MWLLIFTRLAVLASTAGEARSMSTAHGAGDGRDEVLDLIRRGDYRAALTAWHQPPGAREENPALLAELHFRAAVLCLEEAGEDATLAAARAHLAAGRRLAPEDGRFARFLARLETEERSSAARRVVESALELLLAGHRQRAIRRLARALRCAPHEGEVAHALLLACSHGARAALAGNTALAWWRLAIASWPLLVHCDRFWECWRARAQARYEVAAPALSGRGERLRRDVTRWLETALAELPAGRRLRRLLGRELAAAAALAAVGGFKTEHGDDPPLVCGPLMLRQLGRERAFGHFVAALEVEEAGADDPFQRLLVLLAGGEERPATNSSQTVSSQTVEPAARARLLRLFSPLGFAQALLDRDRPREALEALAELSCARCRRRARSAPSSGPGWRPAICRQDCPQLGQRYPAYAALPDGFRAAQHDALALARDAHLALGLAAARGTGTPLQAVEHWREALALGAAMEAREAALERVVEQVLGRVRALRKQARWDEAIALVEAAIPLAGGAGSGELEGLLAKLLTDRGVSAANATPSRWSDAVADLRRAVALNPRAPRTLQSLGIALANWAHESRRQRPQALPEVLTALREGSRVLARGRAELGDRADLVAQHETIRQMLRGLVKQRAVELAEAEDFEPALDLLEEGLRDFPADSGLTKNRKAIFMGYVTYLTASGQLHRARSVLERGKRIFQDDPTMRARLGTMAHLLRASQRRSGG